MAPSEMNNFTLPNALSGSRLLLAPATYMAITTVHWRVAAILMVIAIITDALDGYLARKHDLSSPLGGLLDHGSDAVFVAVTLAALAGAGFVPWLLPILVIAAFIQYMLDSKALAGSPLRASSLGRYNGIAYFVLAAVPTVQSGLGLTILPENLFQIVGWVLVATTIASMIDRAIVLLRTRQR